MLFPSFWYMVTHATNNKLVNNTTKKIFFGCNSPIDSRDDPDRLWNLSEWSRKGHYSAANLSGWSQIGHIWATNLSGWSQMSHSSVTNLSGWLQIGHTPATNLWGWSWIGHTLAKNLLGLVTSQSRLGHTSAKACNPCLVTMWQKPVSPITDNNCVKYLRKCVKK